jgi:predicted nucleotidyltransferase
VLAGTTEGLTGRRIAELAEKTQEGTRKALRRLLEIGIVERQEAGNAILYRLNRRHLAAPAIEQIADLRSRFLGQLTETIEAWRPRPLHVSMFGSAARGDGDTHSDIDLFVVRPSSVKADDQGWQEQVQQLPVDVLAWTGNHANVVEVRESAIADLRQRRPAIVESIEADAVNLIGPSVALLLGGGD